MDIATIWIIILIIGVGTFFIRFSFIHLFEKIDMPPVLIKSLKFIPPAILAALVIPQFIYKNGGLFLSFENERLLAGIVAILLAWYKKNVLITIIGGMVSLWIFQWLI